MYIGKERRVLFLEGLSLKVQWGCIIRVSDLEKAGADFWQGAAWSITQLK
jgi:hypothetical protein